MEILLVRVADGEVVARWTEPGVVPGVPRTVTWDGTAGGKVQREGEYRFQVGVAAAPGVQAASGRSAEVGSAAAVQDEAGTFTFLRHRFPLLGAHDFGEGGARFGGGRGHQGQDVFAACDTPVVAARGGKVQFKEFHARAGNYVVIDGAGTGVDYAYMHLRDAALVEQGDRVRTGQLIGYVGATGRASALPSALRDVEPRPAGTRAARRSTRCPRWGLGRAVLRRAAVRPRHARRGRASRGSRPAP